MRTRIGLSELTPNLLIVILVAMLAIFFVGFAMGQRYPVTPDYYPNDSVITKPGYFEPEPGGGVPPVYRDVDGNEPVACTMDAKVCPDGSYVGRIGPNCEFAACPGEE